jgi:hypothetical protein
MWGVELEPARDAAPLDQAPQALAPARGLRASDQPAAGPKQRPGAGQALYGFLAALTRDKRKAANRSPRPKRKNHQPISSLLSFLGSAAALLCRLGEVVSLAAAANLLTFRAMPDMLLCSFANFHFP